MYIELVTTVGNSTEAPSHLRFPWELHRKPGTACLTDRR